MTDAPTTFVADVVHSRWHTIDDSAALWTSQSTCDCCTELQVMLTGDDSIA